MNTINFLHQLNDDIIELENKYNQALNYIVALRQTQAAILTGIVNDKIDAVKDVFIWKNFKKQQKNLCNSDNIFEELNHYSTNWE